MLANESSELFLERYRAYLTLLARLRIDARLRSKVAPSDVVQEVLLRAHASRTQCQASNAAEVASWLRAILVNVLAEIGCRFSGPSRDINRERVLHVSLEEFSSRLEILLTDHSPTPEKAVDRAEQLLLLARSLDELPEDQRTAIELRYLQGYNAPEIAQLLGRSTASVAGLLRRGLKTLRQVLAKDD